MNLTDFISHFPDEQTCKNKWKGIRIRQGVVCPECGCTEYWWKSDKECFECRGEVQDILAGAIELDEVSCLAELGNL